jgi:hypothetical protein
LWTITSSRSVTSRAAEIAGVSLGAAHSIITEPEIEVLIEQRQADLAADTMFGAESSQHVAIIFDLTFRSV